MYWNRFMRSVAGTKRANGFGGEQLFQRLRDPIFQCRCTEKKTQLAWGALQEKELFARFSASRWRILKRMRTCAATLRKKRLAMRGVCMAAKKPHKCDAQALHVRLSCLHILVAMRVNCSHAWAAFVPTSCCPETSV